MCTEAGLDGAGWGRWAIGWGRGQSVVAAAAGRRVPVVLAVPVVPSRCGRVVAQWPRGDTSLMAPERKTSGGLVVTGAISCGRICYNGLMKTVRVPISSDPEAQAQWEAVIKAFRAEALRRGQEAQARFDAERRRCIFAAVARGRARA